MVDNALEFCSDRQLKVALALSLVKRSRNKAEAAQLKTGSAHCLTRRAPKPASNASSPSDMSVSEINRLAC
jgi:hypothetical protein